MSSLGRLAFVIWASLALAATTLAHPANIPVARAKVSVDGVIELQMRFDILAFVLDEDPMTVLDPPMNALLDGSVDELQGQLEDAEKRFAQGLRLAGGTCDSIDFPTAEGVRRLANSDPKLRLPVMAMVTVRCHLGPEVRESSFSFPTALGPVVLSTEFPYFEPISEQVEPGSWSRVLQLPTKQQIEAVQASIGVRTTAAKNPPKPRTDADVRKQIQKQYDRWTKAYMAHDVTTLLSLLTPDYTLKTAKGAVITRAEYAAMLNIRKQKHDDTTRYKQEILRLTLHDGVAAIWSRETTTSPAKDGKSTSFQHDYIDVWIFSGGKWLLQSSATQQEQRVSG
jgi:ketosteroid isomerase-like protein